uniref:Uncharacterized protein n=1 Tax=Rhizophora mucronata TaxID=61149 RepID=A0A2P2MEB5_RHIMU
MINLLICTIICYCQCALLNTTFDALLTAILKGIRFAFRCTYLPGLIL